MADNITAISSFFERKEDPRTVTPISVKSVVWNAMSVKHPLTAREEGSYPSTSNVAMAVVGLGTSKSFLQAR